MRVSRKQLCLRCLRMSESEMSEDEMPISANISRDLRTTDLQVGGWGKRAHACASRAISEPPTYKSVVGESEHLPAHLAWTILLSNSENIAAARGTCTQTCARAHSTRCRRSPSDRRRAWMAHMTTTGWSVCSMCPLRQRHQDGRCRPSRRKSPCRVWFVRKPCHRQRVLDGHRRTTRGCHKSRSAIRRRPRRSARAAGWGRRCQWRPRSWRPKPSRPPFPYPYCH